MQRTCSKCFVSLPETKEYFQKNGKYFRGECKKCSRVYNDDIKRARHREYYEENRNAIRENAKVRYSKETVEQKEKRQKYVETNREKINKKARESYVKTPEKFKRRNQDYYKANKHYFLERNAARRVRENLSSPVWVSKVTLRVFYQHAEEMSKYSGEVYHVDHIHPLTHPQVCGLHVPANLRVIKGKENLIKGNNFTPYGFDFTTGLYYVLS